MRAHRIYQYFPVWSLCIKLASWIKQLSVPFSKQEVTAGYQIPISRWMICSHSGACKKYSCVCIWLQLRTLVMSFISTQLSANTSLLRRKAADLIDRWRGFYLKNDNKVNVFSLLYCYQPLYPNTIYFYHFAVYNPFLKNFCFTYLSKCPLGTKDIQMFSVEVESMFKTIHNEYFRITWILRNL